MTKDEKRLSTEERKAKIRERYKGVNKDELEVIPARAVLSLKEDSSHKRVAAYCRVSTDDPNQTSSYELQKNHYEEFINEHPGWELVGIYADEGISGTSLAHREEFVRMIADCEAGRIDLIITKSISRFARNTVDSISTVRKLASRPRPIGVLFETENLYTLNQTSEMILTVLSAAAQEESHTKSEIMNISIEHRFSRGIFLLMELLGYDKDEDGNLVVNPSEAETVKVIYYLYLNGFSLREIADILTDYKRKTKLGNTQWKPGSVLGVIKNERHCGDVLARKTFTPSFLDHKSKKNVDERTKYRQRDHHEAIVTREVYEAANRLNACRSYARKKRSMPVLSVVDNGVLRGFVPIDKDWTGFTVEEYQAATESVYDEENAAKTFQRQYRVDRSGYRILREQLFSTRTNPALTISNGKLRFNTGCLKKFKGVEWVELLLNTVDQCIAIRPCDRSNPNAIHWGKLRNTRWVMNSVSCRGLAKTLFDIMDWEENTSYRLRGRFIECGESFCMLFGMDYPEMTRVEEIAVPPMEPDTQLTAEATETNGTNADEGENPREDHAPNGCVQETYIIKRKLRVFPEDWENRYGLPYANLVRVNLLEEAHYAGNWDILRPAQELEEYNVFCEEELAGLMHEAEEIMEGWEYGTHAS